ncbi:MAG: glycoside hydrolase family 3 N-terminal domain-containing protein [bacterium]|nr:glycoside hydrolase family 3 C-terminal domain-containing protein [candidate division KSB1 bacterium]MDH7561673.1 glycoside hydrolase family 3 N-terminal domain-containing protein [bacterium]
MMLNSKGLLLSWLSLLTAGCWLLATVAHGQSRGSTPDYKNAKLPIERRVEDLLSRMTLEEKVAQLQCLIREVEGTDFIKEQGIGNLGCILRQYKAKEAAEKLNRIQKFMLEKTRLGIPVIMHDEALHGLVANGATSFPQAIGLAATWDTELMGRVAHAIAVETKSRGIRQVLSPVVNIARDVRWGRVEETYGEDPYLTARMGAAFCKAFEEIGVITTPKHYAANLGDGGRDSNPVHFSERLMREIYFPGFKACFQEGGATSVMAAYNSYDGTPCSSNRWLLTQVLRNEWGFTGFVVSDYGSVAGILDMHHTAATEKEAAAQALNAGLDVELPNIYIYGEPLLQAVRERLVSEETLNEAVRRVLRAKFKLGLFENPFADAKEAARVNDCAEHRALALETARKAIVLLRNEGAVLPLKKETKTVALIGPLANEVKLGGYSGYGMKTVSVLEGMKKVRPDGRVLYAQGCVLSHPVLPAIPSEYLIPAGGKPGEKGLRGEYFANKELAGDPALVRIDPVLHFDWAGDGPDPSLPTDCFSARWTGKLISPVSGRVRLGISTDDGVRLYLDGKLLVDMWVDRSVTTDMVTVTLEKGRAYDLKIEYYENLGYAFASLGWDLQPEENKPLEEAVAAAKQAEVAIVVVGVVEGEGRDRASLDLSVEQENLIKAVAATGTPTVVVLQTGSAVTMRNWLDQVPAVVQTWYAGEEGGTAVAEVLWGEVNPGGKLPIAFPVSAAQLPLYYNPKPTGRGWDYVDLTGRPLFPFGHGLSYTTFAYSNLRISPERIEATGAATVSVDVQNVGSRAGDEVVQLYIHDVVGSVARPVKELKGFRRITLKPGENTTVTFRLGPPELSMLDRDLKEVVEPGTFEVMVGSSSEDIRVRANLEVVSR